MDDFTHGQIMQHIEFVERGKPCSVLPIKKTQIDTVSELCRGYGILYYVEDIFDGNWFNFWIYKNPIMLEIIKQLPDKPSTPIEHFILGCAFGYSIDSILKFINEQN